MSFCKICSFSCIQDNIIICIVLQSLRRNIVVCLCSICNGYSRTLCRHVLWNEWFCPCLELIGYNTCIAGSVTSQASGSSVVVICNVGINHAEIIVILRTCQSINHFDVLIPILNGDIQLSVVLVTNAGLCQFINSLVSSLCNFCIRLEIRICVPSLCRNLTESCIQLCRGCIGYKIRIILRCARILRYNVMHRFRFSIIYSSSYRNGLIRFVHFNSGYSYCTCSLLAATLLGCSNSSLTCLLCSYNTLAGYSCNRSIGRLPGNALVVEARGSLNGCLQCSLIVREKNCRLLAHGYGLGLQICYFNLDGLLCSFILLGGCCNLYSSLLLSGYVAGFGNGGNLLVAALPFNGLACLGRFCFINRYLYFTLDIHCSRSGLEVNLLRLLCCRISGNGCHRHGQCHAQCQHDGEHFLRTLHVQIPPSFINTVQLIEGSPPFTAFQKRKPYAIIITIFH